jgi:sugar phosphate isomerase/epimerase
MQIGIASYAFHGLLREGKMDVFGYLESVKYRYGLQVADIWNGMLPSMDLDDLAKVKDALQERELTLANLCVDGAHIWEDDAETREAHHQNALASLRAAAFLGARTLRIDAGGAGDVFTTEQFDLVIQRYREYTAFAADHGFRVGPENHWGPERVFGNMERIFQAVDHPSFGLLLHFGNWAGLAPDEADAAMAPRAMHMHMSWQITEGPLAAKMETLREAGYSGCWSIEHHTGQNEYTEVGVQVARVRDVLDRWRLEGKA